MSDEELFPLFEAARWAPSSYNGQPWRILYAKRDTPEWDQFFDLLAEPNKVWCKNAAALVVMVSRNTYERNNKPAPTHSYDTGSAWMSIVAAELAVGSKGGGGGTGGIGQMMFVFYAYRIELNSIVVCMIAVGLVALAIDYGLRRLQQRLLPWA